MRNLRELQEVNAQVQQEGVNTARSRNEEIRRRLANPGLYPEQVQQQQQYTTTGRQPTNPMNSNPTLANVFGNSGGYTSTGEGGQDASANSGSGYGMGMPGGLASGIGKGVGMAASMNGVPFGGILGTAIGGVLGGKSPDQQQQAMMNSILGAVVSGLTKGTPVGMMLGLASLFGFNPIQGFTEMLGLSDVTPGFEGGFMGTPGIGQGISGIGNTPGMDTSSPMGMSPNDLGMGITGIATGLQDAMAGFGTTSGMGLGSDPGPSGTGNRGDPAEGLGGDASDSGSSGDAADAGVGGGGY